MELIIKLLIGLIALIHLFFLWFEMFAWTTLGKKLLKQYPEDLFEKSKVLAANQGLYNGFLAAGLVWTFFIEDKLWQTNVSVFFLSCIIIAGIYGAYSSSKKIFFMQALPAIIALCLLLTK
jgi:putative membrane protein